MFRDNHFLTHPTSRPPISNVPSDPRRIWAQVTDRIGIRTNSRLGRLSDNRYEPAIPRPRQVQ